MDSYMLRLIINTGVHSHKQLREYGVVLNGKIRDTGTARHYLKSYLSEFIWCQHQVKENRDCFESILNSISAHFPPKSN